jgi:hypothetical protein
MALTGAYLSQVVRFADWRRAVEDEFRGGGSLFWSLLAFAGLVIVVVMVYWLSERQQKKIDGVNEYRNPQRLFRDLLQRLELLPPQRQLLETVARDQRLKHPTVILLSEGLYDRHVNEWLRSRNRPVLGTEGHAETQSLTRARRRLFRGRT